MSHPSSRFSIFAVVMLSASLVTMLGCPNGALASHTLLGRVMALEDALETTQADLQTALSDLADTQSDLAMTQADLASTQSDLADAQAKLAYFNVEEDPINGLNGPHLIIEGCNVHVRSGSGDTDDSSAGGLTGLGNLIIGYNEPALKKAYGRLGSHNLVIGPRHEYSSYGGFVIGYANRISGVYSSVTGGTYNDASDTGSSVSGGESNTASGVKSSVSGGFDRTAADTYD